MSWRSSSRPCEKAPGRLAQVVAAVPAKFGFALFADGWAPGLVAGLVGTTVVFDVPPEPAVAPGAIVARAKMSYMLMPCTSYPVRKMLKSRAGYDQSVQTTTCAICGRSVTFTIVNSVVRAVVWGDLKSTSK